MAGFCEHGNHSSGSVKCPGGGLLEYMKNYLRHTGTALTPV